ncbi:GRAM domain-containing protein 4-like isoform X3 [Varroa jacobsoni]|uniref:GRAM domain-containing protein 4-like isoform X3 n=1 Tax=Varroa jacobsoni TaxID=62625 RepID=UPI000BF87D0D|nr:GRAM domain-containing protein 4-like isoform X3 [Varroa jacobsoni]
MNSVAPIFKITARCVANQSFITTEQIQGLSAFKGDRRSIEMFATKYYRSTETLLAIPLLIGRNVSCPDLRQELERQEREEQAQQQQLLTYKSLNDSSSDMVDLVSTAADRDIEDNEFRGSFGVRLPELGVDIGSMECLLADDELAPSPTPLEDCNKNSSELSIRKLGNEDSLLRTSLRRRRDSNSISSVASLAVPKITVSDHSKKRSSMSSFTASLWKLSKLAKRWYCQLKEDFSEMRPFEIEDKPLFEVDEFSIKNTTDALNRFDDLFAALVDGPLRDSYNEALRVTQWTYPLQTLLTLIVLLHSLWMDYLVALVLVSLCVSLIRNYMIAQGWIIEKDRMDVDTRRRTNAVRVTKLFQLNLRVVKVFQLLTDGMDKGLALWTWKRPEITGILFGTLAGGALLSVLAPAGLLIKFVGTGLLAKLFLFDYIFFRFPRVRAKYDLLYNWFKELPTSKDLERQRKFHKSLKISKSTNDLALARAAFDPSVLRKLEEKLSNLFELDRIESLVTGWELGKRCTLINKDKALTGAFKSGRLFLTEGHLLFMRYKAQSPKNISIALGNIVRVEKGKHSGWLPGDAQTVEITIDQGITFSFGALANRDDVHREILVHAAQHAYKRKMCNRSTY